MISDGVNGKIKEGPFTPLESPILSNGVYFYFSSKGFKDLSFNLRKGVKNNTAKIKAETRRMIEKVIRTMV